jgi:tetratricopeptide (TPR) repeat protein
VRDDGNTEIEVQVLNRMGPPLVATGQAAQALEHYQRALAIAAELADRYEQALALDGIGRCLARAGDDTGARLHLGRAAALYDELGTPPAARLR